jgi:hypothetical protein
MRGTINFARHSRVKCICRRFRPANFMAEALLEEENARLKIRSRPFWTRRRRQFPWASERQIPIAPTKGQSRTLVALIAAGKTLQGSPDQTPCSVGSTCAVCRSVSIDRAFFAMAPSVSQGHHSENPASHRIGHALVSVALSIARRVTGSRDAYGWQLRASLAGGRCAKELSSRGMW